MVKEPRWILRLESFGKALASLCELTDMSGKADDVIVDATIQRFEVTFELAWKTIQDYLTESGITEFKGPRKVIVKAYGDGLIGDGQIWLNMLNDRNTLAHEYTYEESRIVYRNIVSSYVTALKQLYGRMKDE